MPQRPRRGSRGVSPALLLGKETRTGARGSQRAAGRDLPPAAARTRGPGSSALGRPLLPSWESGTPPESNCTPYYLGLSFLTWEMGRRSCCCLTGFDRRRLPPNCPGYLRPSRGGSQPGQEGQGPARGPLWSPGSSSLTRCRSRRRGSEPSPAAPCQGGDPHPRCEPGGSLPCSVPQFPHLLNGACCDLAQGCWVE